MSGNNQKDLFLREMLKPISASLATEGVNEIAINTPGEYLVKTSQGWQAHSEPLLTYEHLRTLKMAIATYNKIEASAIMSAELSTGERVQIESEPVTRRGIIAVNIRRHQEAVQSLADLNAGGSFSNVADVSYNLPSETEIQALLNARDRTRLLPIEAELLRLKAAGQWFEFLRTAVIHHQNMVISGPTGSGKTTAARSLIEEVPLHERIITFEEQHELILNKHQNKVHLFYGDGPGRVTAKECLKAAMRMSPERIFPAELRSDESWDYLQTLNTGHPGSITTLHSNSADQSFNRIFGMVKGSAVGRGLDSEWVMSEIYRSIHISMHFEKRKLVQIYYDPIHAKKQVM